MDVLVLRHDTDTPTCAFGARGAFARGVIFYDALCGRGAQPFIQYVSPRAYSLDANLAAAVYAGAQTSFTA